MPETPRAFIKRSYLLVVLSIFGSWGAIQAQAVQVNKIYWTDETAGTLSRANLDGSNVEVLLTGLTGPRSLDVDPVSQQLYWIDGEIISRQINRSDLEGNNIVNVYNIGNDDGWGLAVDPTNQRVFWSDQDSGGGTDYIRSVTFTGADLQNVAVGTFSGPRGVAVDPSTQRIYYADILEDRISRINYDGTGQLPLVTDTNYTNSPFAIAIDPDSQTVFWTANSGVVLADFAGNNIVSLNSQPRARYGIDVNPAEGKVYWGDAQNDLLVRRSIDNTSYEELATANPYGIALVAYIAPEPSSLVLAAFGLIAFAFTVRRRRKR